MGIIGDQHRMDAATISDAVNTAARVESLSKHFGGAILLSEDSLARLAHPERYHLRSLGLVQVAGKRHPIRIYECFDGDAPAAIRKKEENRQRFDQGLKAYLDGDFTQAQADFTDVLRNHPEDRAARLFLDSASDLRQDGMPAGWAGIIAMQQK
jgi:TolA-binding protein